VALQPPAELAAALTLVGVPWPVADEEKLHESGRRWVAFAMTLRRNVSTADAHVVRTVSRNDGDDVRAFERDSRDTSSQGGDAVTAALLIGSALQISAMAVLTLKVALVVILVRFALRLSQLVTASGPTAGASLTAVPVVVGSARMAVRQAIRKMVDLLKRSALRLFTQASDLLRKLPSRGSTAAPPPRCPPTPLRGPDNYLEAAADKSVNVRKVAPYPMWRREREPLYRADDRSPDEMFDQGFHPRDPTMTALDDYVNTSRPSAFVGTSQRQDIDNVFPRGYVYEVDAPGGIDVSRTMPEVSTRLGHEQEVAFVGGVHRRYVSGAWPSGVAKTPSNFIPNPHFDPYPGYSQA
jgi:hypothetical protein